MIQIDDTTTLVELTRAECLKELLLREKHPRKYSEFTNVGLQQELEAVLCIQYKKHIKVRIIDKAPKLTNGQVIDCLEHCDKGDCNGCLLYNSGFCGRLWRYAADALKAKSEV